MAAKRRKKRKIFSPIYLTLVLLVLYLPILMVVIYSFNSGRTIGAWQGFTTSWYTRLFGNALMADALKNSLIPVITYFGPMLAYIVTGSIVVEQIFAVPGIGRAFVNSITGRDYPLIMGTTIILACLIIIMNLVSDLLYKIVDPRIELD